MPRFLLNRKLTGSVAGVFQQFSQNPESATALLAALADCFPVVQKCDSVRFAALALPSFQGLRRVVIAPPLPLPCPTSHSQLLSPRGL
jgi:hypothetical protein